MNKAWWTEEEYKQRIATAAGRGDPSRQQIEKGEYGRALLSGVTDPSTPQRQTTLIVDPPNGLLPPLTTEGKRRALEMRSGGRSRRVARLRLAHGLRQLGPLRHARHALVDDALSLQRRVQDLAGAARRRTGSRDDRHAHHLHGGRPPLQSVQSTTWAIRAAAGEGNTLVVDH
jgi:hypothetical protein